MYERFFGFTAKPFALTPDPAFLYESRQHARAMTMLEYGLESEAPFSLLTGEIGSGKTTLLRRLLRELGDRVSVGLVSHTHARFHSLHGWVLSSLGIVPADDSEIAQYEALVDSFIREYARKRRTLLIFDEAQNLSIDALEELRLLSNVNSEKDVILQILLVGQPELREKLSRPELRQFAQRISVDYHLHSLSRTETYAYIKHRLLVAGGDPDLFEAKATERLFEYTQGLPRLVNKLADVALVYAFAERRKIIDVELIDEILRDRSEVRTPRTAAGPELTPVSPRAPNSGVR